MSVLNHLALEVPKRRPIGEQNPQYQATKKLFHEIGEAQRRGYTWSQICAAARKEWVETGVWQESWRSCDTQRFFAQIKKDSVAAE